MKVAGLIRLTLHKVVQKSRSMASATVFRVIPNLKLNNGNEIPIIGLGTWQAEPGEVGPIIQAAIDIGYRHFDCAYLYQNEAEIGQAIKAKIQSGAVQRSELFITSKLWNTDHRPDLVIPAIKKSLAALELEYLDLYLIHFPMAYKETGEIFPTDKNGKPLYSEVDYIDTWKAMEKCVTLGLSKSIGISNFNSQQIKRVLSIATIKPTINQVECHPYLPQKKLVEFCKATDIIVTGYSPLGSDGRPWAQASEPRLLDDPILVELGKKYNKSPAQIALCWMVQLGIVTVPKSTKPERLVENISIFDFNLSSNDLELISTMDKGENGRFMHFKWTSDHKDYPFNIEF